MSKHTKYLKCILYINHLETSQQLILQDVGSTMNMMNKNEKKNKYIYRKKIIVSSWANGWNIWTFFYHLETSQQPILPNVQIGKEHDDTVQMKK